MKKLLAGLAFAALGCGSEGSTELADPVRTVAQSLALSLEPKALTEGVITNLDRLDPVPNPRFTVEGPFLANPVGCHHVQSAAKYKDHYLLSHSMPDEAHLAVVDSDGLVHKVPLPRSDPEERTPAHPGGIQVMGDILAVALSDVFFGASYDAECETAAGVLPDLVRFYDICNPLIPVAGALPDLTLPTGTSAQAVAATRLGGSTVVALVTGTRALRFFTLADTPESDWVDAGGWEAEFEPDMPAPLPDDDHVQQKTCGRAGLAWCRPDTINLYRDPSGQLKLLTFSRGTKLEAFDRERIGVYHVTLAAHGVTVSHRKTYEFLPDGSYGNFRYGGGSEVTDDGTLMAFAFPKHLSDGDQTSFARYGGWSKASVHDTGRNATVALNDSGVAVQVRQAANGAKLYYRVGQVNQVTRKVSWKAPVPWVVGANPSVALDAAGNVVVLHTVYGEVTPDIFSCVGKVNVAGGTIDWPPQACVVTDTGTHPTVAMNRDGGVIEVHNGSREDNNRTLYVRVGSLASDGQSVIFGESDSFDTGADSSVTLNGAGTVVEAHNGTTATTERNLYFTVGRADFGTKTVTWGDPSKHGTGSHLSIGLNDNDELVELHHGSMPDTEARIYFSVGTPSADNETITWKPGVGGRRDTGTDVAVAIANAGILLETHNAPTSNVDTALRYSVADMLRLP